MAMGHIHINITEYSTCLLWKYFFWIVLSIVFQRMLLLVKRRKQTSQTIFLSKRKNGVPVYFTYANWMAYKKLRASIWKTLRTTTHVALYLILTQMWINLQTSPALSSSQTTVWEPHTIQKIPLTTLHFYWRAQMFTFLFFYIFCE